MGQQVEGGPDKASDFVINAIDFEDFEYNPYRLTEVGVAVPDSRDIRGSSARISFGEVEGGPSSTKTRYPHACTSNPPMNSQTSDTPLDNMPYVIGNNDTRSIVDQREERTMHLSNLYYRLQMRRDQLEAGTWALLNERIRNQTQIPELDAQNSAWGTEIFDPIIHRYHSSDKTGPESRISLSN
ncbi:uncharacterized protein BDZ99DRAFT_527361 [Mytilinidion resinicola]|uniref:Uncharacterized protein n=1 Tax=Mytilinidion resinicola TaxID=574789 RepID=A0A6A6Y1X0_9PEZI|nr:uncharacterized protein BDZ99DRAFT_527361 [Mytilinidion resinicola]KAF2802639.1 hypothetical protein BDZ99DRAFT_527361 [Mytilinidion resinicola]